MTTPLIAGLVSHNSGDRGAVSRLRLIEELKRSSRVHLGFDAGGPVCVEVPDADARDGAGPGKAVFGSRRLSGEGTRELMLDVHLVLELVD